MSSLTPIATTRFDVSIAICLTTDMSFYISLICCSYSLRRAVVKDCPSYFCFCICYCLSITSRFDSLMRSSFIEAKRFSISSGENTSKNYFTLVLSLFSFSELSSISIKLFCLSMKEAFSLWNSSINGFKFSTSADRMEALRDCNLSMEE